MYSAEWIVKRSCTNKKSYSKEEAEIIVDMKALKGDCIFWYHCPFCMRYHLSRSPTPTFKLEVLGGNRNPL